MISIDLIATLSTVVLHELADEDTSLVDNLVMHVGELSAIDAGRLGESLQELAACEPTARAQILDDIAFAWQFGDTEEGIFFTDLAELVFAIREELLA